MSSDIRVLHVDDEPDFAEMVSTFLSREDDGIEVVTENKREDVFKPGFTTKKGSEGTGMGLASVRQIVVAHGWEIDVHDAEELEGVRFEIRTHG
jgi:signal transduction histidine kinase